MRITETLRLVFYSITENSLKVLLTALGIIVGSATIVMVIAIGQGGQDEIKAQFDDLSVAAIYINASFSSGSRPGAASGMTMGGGMGGMAGGPPSMSRSGGTGGMGAGSAARNLSAFRLPQLTFENITQIKEEASAVEAVALTATSQTAVALADEEATVTVAAVTGDYFDITGLGLLSGYLITDVDSEYQERVAVIGYGVCEDYFGNEEYALGQEIRIDKKKYTVVGVLDRKGDSIQNVFPDDSIFVPYTTGVKDLFGSRMVMPNAIAVAESADLVETAIAQIRDSLEYIMGDDSENFTMEDAGSRLNAASESSRTMTLLLVSVASIVFIVGGIGIMNVMFVTVKERTREIGILKALGTSKGDILMQFLIEAVLISSAGGLIGVGLSMLAMPLMNYTDIPVTPSFSGKILALLFSALTGTVFGFYPALKASQLQPVEALNHE